MASANLSEAILDRIAQSDTPDTGAEGFDNRIAWDDFKADGKSFSNIRSRAAKGVVSPNRIEEVHETMRKTVGSWYNFLIAGMAFIYNVSFGITATGKPYYVLDAVPSPSQVIRLHKNRNKAREEEIKTLADYVRAREEFEDYKANTDSELALLEITQQQEIIKKDIGFLQSKLDELKFSPGQTAYRAFLNEKLMEYGDYSHIYDEMTAEAAESIRMMTSTDRFTLLDFSIYAAAPLDKETIDSNFDGPLYANFNNSRTPVDLMKAFLPPESLECESSTNMLSELLLAMIDTAKHRTATHLQSISKSEEYIDLLIDLSILDSAGPRGSRRRKQPLKEASAEFNFSASLFELGGDLDRKAKVSSVGEHYIQRTEGAVSKESKSSSMPSPGMTCAERNRMVRDPGYAAESLKDRISFSKLSSSQRSWRSVKFQHVWYCLEECRLGPFMVDPINNPNVDGAVWQIVCCQKMTFALRISSSESGERTVPQTFLHIFNEEQTAWLINSLKGLSAVMISQVIQRPIYPEWVPNKFMAAVIEQLQLVRQHGDCAMAIVKDIVPIIVQFLAVKESAVIYSQTAFENMMKVFEEELAPDGKKLRPKFLFRGSALEYLLVHLPPGLIAEVTALKVFTPQPILNIYAMCAKKMLDSTAIHQLNLDAVQEITGNLTHHLARHIVNILKRAPIYDVEKLEENCDDEEEFNHILGVLVGAAAENRVPSGFSTYGEEPTRYPDSLSYQEWSKVCFKRGENLSITNLNSPVEWRNDSSSYHSEDSLPEFIESGRISLKNKKLILHILLKNNELNIDEYLDVANNLLDKATHAFDSTGQLQGRPSEWKGVLGGSYPKSTERKDVPREFVSHCAEIRNLHVIWDSAVDSLMKSVEGFSMSGSRESQTQRVRFVRKATVDPEYIGFSIDTDVSSWCGDQDENISTRCTDKIGQAFNIGDDPYCTRATLIFGKISYLANQGKETLITQGARRGKEGQFQKLWTMKDKMALEIFYRDFPYPRAVGLCGDDRIEGTITDIEKVRHPDNLVRVSKIVMESLERMQMYNVATSHKNKESQSNISDSVSCFLGKVDIKLQSIARSAKFVAKIPAGTDSLDGDLTSAKLISIAAAGQAAAQNATDTISVYKTTKLMQIMTLLYGVTSVGGEYRSWEFCSDAERVAVCFTPIQLTGVDSGGPMSYMVMGQSDNFIEFFHVVGKLLATDGKLASELRGPLVNMLLRRSSTAPLLTMLTDAPWSFNVYSPPNTKNVHKSFMKKNMGLIVKRESMREGMTTDGMKDAEKFIEYLFKWDHMGPVMASYLCDETPWKLQQEMIDAINTTSTFRYLIEVLDPKEINRHYRKLRMIDQHRAKVMKEIMRGTSAYSSPPTYNTTRELKDIIRLAAVCPANSVYQYRCFMWRECSSYRELELWKKMEDTKVDYPPAHEWLAWGKDQDGLLLGNIKIAKRYYMREDHILTACDMANAVPVKTAPLTSVSLADRSDSLAIRMTAVLAAKQAALEFNGSDFSPIFDTLREAYGLENVDMVFYPDMDKQTPHHHMNPGPKRMTSGINGEANMTAGMKVITDLRFPHTNRQPMRNFAYALGYHYSVGQAMILRVFWKDIEPVIAIRFNYCEYCMGQTQTPLMRPPPEDPPVLSKDIVQVVMNMRIETESSTMRGLETFKTSKEFWDRSNPTIELYVHKLKNSEDIGAQEMKEILQVSRAVETLTVIQRAMAHGMFRDISNVSAKMKARSVKEMSMGVMKTIAGTAISQTATLVCSDPLLLIRVAAGMMNMEYRRLYEKEGIDMTVQDWQHLLSDKPNIFPIMELLIQMYVKTNLAASFTQAMSYVTGVSTPSYYDEQSLKAYITLCVPALMAAFDEGAFGQFDAAVAIDPSLDPLIVSSLICSEIKSKIKWDIVVPVISIDMHDLKDIGCSSKNGDAVPWDPNTPYEPWELNNTTYSLLKFDQLGELLFRQFSFFSPAEILKLSYKHDPDSELNIIGGQDNLDAAECSLTIMITEFTEKLMYDHFGNQMENLDRSCDPDQESFPTDAVNIDGYQWLTFHDDLRRGQVYSSLRVICYGAASHITELFSRGRARKTPAIMREINSMVASLCGALDRYRLKCYDSVTMSIHFLMRSFSKAWMANKNETVYFVETVEYQQALAVAGGIPMGEYPEEFIDQCQSQGYLPPTRSMYYSNEVELEKGESVKDLIQKRIYNNENSGPTRHIDYHLEYLPHFTKKGTKLPTPWFGPQVLTGPKKSSPIMKSMHFMGECIYKWEDLMKDIELGSLMESARIQSRLQERDNPEAASVQYNDSRKSFLRDVHTEMLIRQHGGASTAWYKLAEVLILNNAVETLEIRETGIIVCLADGGGSFSSYLLSLCGESTSLIYTDLDQYYMTESENISPIPPEVNNTIKNPASRVLPSILTPASCDLTSTEEVRSTAERIEATCNRSGQSIICLTCDAESPDWHLRSSSSKEGEYGYAKLLLGLLYIMSHNQKRIERAVIKSYTDSSRTACRMLCYLLSGATWSTVTKPSASYNNNTEVYYYLEGPFRYNHQHVTALLYDGLPMCTAEIIGGLTQLGRVYESLKRGDSTSKGLYKRRKNLTPEEILILMTANRKILEMSSPFYKPKPVIASLIRYTSTVPVTLAQATRGAKARVFFAKERLARTLPRDRTSFEIKASGGAKSRQAAMLASSAADETMLWEEYLNLIVEGVMTGFVSYVAESLVEDSLEIHIDGLIRQHNCKEPGKSQLEKEFATAVCDIKELLDDTHIVVNYDSNFILLVQDDVFYLINEVNDLLRGLVRLPYVPSKELSFRTMEKSRLVRQRMVMAHRPEASYSAFAGVSVLKKASDINRKLRRIRRLDPRYNKRVMRLKRNTDRRKGPL